MLPPYRCRRHRRAVLDSRIQSRAPCSPREHRRPLEPTPVTNWWYFTRNLRAQIRQGNCKNGGVIYLCWGRRGQKNKIKPLEFVSEVSENSPLFSSSPILDSILKTYEMNIRGERDRLLYVRWCIFFIRDHVWWMRVHFRGWPLYLGYLILFFLAILFVGVLQVFKVFLSGKYFCLWGIFEILFLLILLFKEYIHI